MSTTVVRTYVDSNGNERKVFGFLADGECETCDSFTPYGPRHDTRHGHHCSCRSCF